MIGLDTNVLARYYIQDDGDAEAIKQREAARKLMESGEPLMVCKTVLLELEWVLRGYYKFSTAQIAGVMNHLLALPQVTVEDRESIVQALSHCRAGLELAHAFHHASYRGCDSMASFDDKQFARRARRMGLVPRVVVPG
ncbi:MAG: type II toxin-antitoxin system VapC family toxin [Pseudomonadota bacterium]|nr:type II toxin-antitoxin system VapC family toxin [Pseudomonadota bacterium]